MQTQPQTVRRAGKALVAGLMVALHLLVAFLAVEHGAHRHLHSEADSASHHCAVTLLSSGLVMAAVAAVAVAVAAAGYFFLLPVLQPVPIRRIAGRQHYGRAPPRG